MTSQQATEILERWQETRGLGLTDEERVDLAFIEAAINRDNYERVLSRVAREMQQ